MEILASCRQFEADGANAIYVMATGVYPFERFAERLAAVVAEAAG